MSMRSSILSRLFRLFLSNLAVLPKFPYFLSKYAAKSRASTKKLYFSGLISTSIRQISELWGLKKPTLIFRFLLWVNFIQFIYQGHVGKLGKGIIASFFELYFDANCSFRVEIGHFTCLKCSIRTSSQNTGFI